MILVLTISLNNAAPYLTKNRKKLVVQFFRAPFASRPF